MIRVVIDTNVLVSGLLSPFGPPGQILRMISSGEIRLLFDARILLEYLEVLARPRFGFDQSAVSDLLYWVEHEGEVVAAPPLQTGLPDPFDEPFLEAALSGHAACLVTGDIAHFPESSRQGMAVLLPAEFIAGYGVSAKAPGGEDDADRSFPSHRK